MKALLLGNSPALVEPSIDLSLIPRGEVVVFGANRLWHATRPEWQLILPDFLGMIDNGIEPDWLPPEELLHGVVVPKGNVERAAKYGGVCSFAGRKDLIERQTQGLKTMRTQFPLPGEPYMAASSTPAHLAQFILEMWAFTKIGILGVDYSARELFQRAKREGTPVQTHWYGFNPKCGSGPTFHGMQSPSYQFWTRFRAHCKKIGVQVRNLSPYQKTEFDKAAIPRQSFKDWISSPDCATARPHAGEQKADTQ